MTSVEIKVHIPTTSKTGEITNDFIASDEVTTSVKFFGFPGIRISHPEGPEGPAQIQEVEDIHRPDETNHDPILLYPGQSPLRVMGNTFAHAYLEVLHSPLSHTEK